MMLQIQYGDPSLKQKKQQQQQRHFVFQSQTNFSLFTAVRRALNHPNLATFT